MKKFITILICLFTMGIYVQGQTQALDTAVITRQKTDEAIIRNHINNVIELYERVSEEINSSVKSGLYFGVVRVNDFSDVSINAVMNNLKQYGYDVTLDTSGKHRQYKNIFIRWENK